jgi:hypothetical protein
VIRRPSLPALVVVAALTVAGCGGGSGSSEPATGGSGSTSSTGTSDTPSSSGPIEPETVEGVKLTAPGTHLKLGETARVSWHPDQKTTGVVALTVTGLLKMPISTFSAWRLEPDTRRSTPYFVQVSVRNLGHSDLSHVRVPLYLLDKRGSLLQASTFRAQFTPCPSRPLPEKFKRGARTDVCLVYFAPDHGELVAISFRPTEDFDAIVWQGDVLTGGERQHKKKH